MVHNVDGGYSFVGLAKSAVCAAHQADLPFQLTIDYGRVN